MRVCICMGNSQKFDNWPEIRPENAPPPPVGLELGRRHHLTFTFSRISPNSPAQWEWVFRNQMQFSKGYYCSILDNTTETKELRLVYYKTCRVSVWFFTLGNVIKRLNFLLQKVYRENSRIMHRALQRIGRFKHDCIIMVHLHLKYRRPFSLSFYWKEMSVQHDFFFGWFLGDDLDTLELELWYLKSEPVHLWNTVSAEQSNCFFRSCCS